MIIRDFIRNGDKRLILREVSSICSSVSQLKNNLQLDVSKTTIFRTLHQAENLKFIKVKQKPRLKKPHKNQHLRWAKTHIRKATNRENIIWSDEKNLNLDAHDSYRYYLFDLRKQEMVFLSAFMVVVFVMIWVCFSIGWNV